jgi:hypothetical protein
MPRIMNTPALEHVVLDEFELDRPKDTRFQAWIMEYLHSQAHTSPALTLKWELPHGHLVPSDVAHALQVLVSPKAACVNNAPLIQSGID